MFHSRKSPVLSLFLAVILLICLLPIASVAGAAPLAQGESYTVQKDDSLWNVAEKYLGNGAVYPAIVDATNKKAAEDATFATIVNPSLIQPGWKLWVPSTEEAEAFMERIQRVEKLIQTFEQEIELLREELNIPGMSVAVLQGQEVVFARGFGYADVENEIPATENTPYYIASCTKPFAAAVLMKLVEGGQLDLEAEMADILGDATFPFPDGAIHGYAGLCETIIELSQDTSGPYAPYRFLFEDYRCDTKPITVRHHLTHTSQGTPGEAYRYNGFLYGLLSWVVEAASEESFADLLVEYITAPLEMTSTVPNSSDSRRQQVLAELAKAYQIDDAGNVVLSDFTQDLNGGAGMISTVLDLAKFDVAMDRNLIVSEGSKEAMFTPTLSNSGQPLPYGMGWFVQEHEGVQLIWHYGQQTTYSSLILKMPEEGLTLILLANSDGASAPFNLGDGNVLRSPFAVMFINLFTDIEIDTP
jgi:CubicO group peptidase (beta-lactamase class C family)